MTAPATARTGRGSARDIRLEREGRFLVGHSGSSAAVEAEGGALGRPGLWNRVSGGSAVFALPAKAVSALGPATGRSPDDIHDLLLGWMHDTREGGLPREWGAPAADEADGWTAPGTTAVTSGSCITRIEPVHGQRRIALRGVVVTCSAPLSGARARWASQLIADAVERHRTVRLGWEDSSPDRRLIAETDLSGAPRDWLEPLFPYALNELRRCIQPLLEPLHLLCDPTTPDFQFLGVGHEQKGTEP